MKILSTALSIVVVLLTLLAPLLLERRVANVTDSGAATREMHRIVDGCRNRLELELKETRKALLALSATHADQRNHKLLSSHTTERLRKAGSFLRGHEIELTKLIDEADHVLPLRPEPRE